MTVVCFNDLQILFHKGNTQSCEPGDCLLILRSHYPHLFHILYVASSLNFSASPQKIFGLCDKSTIAPSRDHLPFHMLPWSSKQRDSDNRKVRRFYLLSVFLFWFGSQFFEFLFIDPHEFLEGVMVFFFYSRFIVVNCSFDDFFA